MNDGHTLDVVVCDNCRELLGVIDAVELRTADESDSGANKLIVDISVSGYHNLLERG